MGYLEIQVNDSFGFVSFKNFNCITKICSAFLIMQTFYKTKEFQILEVEEAFKLQEYRTFVLFEKHMYLRIIFILYLEKKRTA